MGRDLYDQRNKHNSNVAIGVNDSVASFQGGLNMYVIP